MGTFERNDLKIYKSAVKDYAKRHESYLFHNEGEEHAKVIFSNIFLNANKNVRIAAGKLCNAVVKSSEYIDSLKTFLNKKDSHLYILISEMPAKEEFLESNSIYRTLYYHPAYNEERISIKYSKGYSFKDEQGKKIHFCTGDDNMYRYEDEITNRKAIANFNDEISTKHLITIFDSAYQNLQNVDLSQYYATAQ